MGLLDSFKKLFGGKSSDTPEMGETPEATPEAPTPTMEAPTADIGTGGMAATPEASVDEPPVA